MLLRSFLQIGPAPRLRPTQQVLPVLQVPALILHPSPLRSARVLFASAGVAPTHATNRDVANLFYRSASSSGIRRINTPGRSSVVFRDALSATLASQTRKIEIATKIPCTKAVNLNSCAQLPTVSTRSRDETTFCGMSARNILNWRAWSLPQNDQRFVRTTLATHPDTHPHF